MGFVLDWMLLKYNGDITQVVPIMEAFRATHCTEKIDFHERQEMALDTFVDDMEAVDCQQKFLIERLHNVDQEIKWRNVLTRRGGWPYHLQRLFEDDSDQFLNKLREDLLSELVLYATIPNVKRVIQTLEAWGV